LLLASSKTREKLYYGWANLGIAALAMVGTLPGRTQRLGLVTEPLIADLHLDRVTLAGDLASGNVAAYNFITPNVCDDMHDHCPPGNAIQHGDTWLSQNVPVILNSAVFQTGGALFITWDEAARGDGPIGMIVLSPFAKGGGFENFIHYEHGSTLRTMEEIFGVTPLLNDAAAQTDLSDFFTVFPKTQVGTAVYVILLILQRREIIQGDSPA
jgi:hypothetical protein